MNSALIPNLFLDQESSDVQLHIESTDDGSQKLVPAHRLVLRFASKVFRTMLENENFNEGRTGILDLKVKGNMEDAIFFLRYLYTRELEPLDLNVYSSLLQTAHLYGVEDLVSLCEERIVGAVTPLTVCRTHEILKQVSSVTLLVHCKDLMLQFGFIIFRKDLHLFLSEETMSFLFASDELNVLDEEQALGALWRWGYVRQVLDNKPAKDIDQQIEKILPLVRATLIKDVARHSPWFALWEDFKSRTDATGGSDCDPSAKPGIAIRQPNVKIKNNRFFEVAYLSGVVDQCKEMSTFGKSNCLMVCSVDRDILVSGITIQLEIEGKIISPYTFQIYVNNKKVSQSNLFDKFFVSDRTIQREAYNDFGRQTIITVTFTKYDLLIHFLSPMLLQKTVVNRLTIDITPDPPSSMSLTTYIFPKGPVFHCEGNLQFLAHNETVAVSHIRYFV